MGMVAQGFLAQGTGSMDDHGVRPIDPAGEFAHRIIAYGKNVQSSFRPSLLDVVVGGIQFLGKRARSCIIAPGDTTELPSGSHDGMTQMEGHPTRAYQYDAIVQR